LCHSAFQIFFILGVISPFPTQSQS
jgi:hypothetical protein